MNEALFNWLMGFISGVTIAVTVCFAVSSYYIRKDIYRMLGKK